MKKMLLSVVLPVFLILLGFGNSRGADFCVNNVTLTLQNALNTAASNNESDLIQIVQGTYNGNFYFSSSQGDDITIRGGYEKSGIMDCLFPTPPPSPTETILDGGGSGRVLLVYEDLGGNIVVERLTIQNGSFPAGDAGGLLAKTGNSAGNSGDISLSHNIIENNHADRFSGVWADSYMPTGASATITMTDNIIRDNSSINNYGGAGVRSESRDNLSGNVTVSNNIITNNTSSNGTAGGLYVHSEGATTGTVTVSNNVIDSNSSYGYGGGAYIIVNPESGPFAGVVLTNNIITGNNSNDFGGGLYVYCYGTLGTGNITLTHNTISGNNADVLAGGARLRGPGIGILNVYNNIFWGNTALAGDDIEFSSFQVTNGYNNNYGVMVGTWDNEANNINQNPDFIGGGDFHLQPHSPCIDTGTASAPAIPASDIDGDDRIMGRAPDMGADELVPLFHWIMFVPAITGAGTQE